MKKSIKKVLSFALMSTLLAASLIAPIPATADEYDHTLNLTINGTDCSTADGNIILYPNTTSTTRAIKADTYYFRYSKIMVFDKDGYLIEAGGDLFANSATVTGSPQEYVYVPAGGFAIAFNPGAVPDLYTCFKAAMEDAMLYNATMSVIYEVKGSYSGNTLTVQYNDPVAPSANAKKFLFVGNSSTYFNGTPIKFKGLAASAGIEVDVDYSTAGSAFLYQFANESHDNGKLLRNKLNSNSYDYVVLQDGGSATYADSKPTMPVLLPLIEQNGAEALLYMRYSSNSNPELRLESATRHYINYTRLSREHGLVCAPAASAFLICTEKYPDINLYADDNSHHSKEGSYLIACVMLYTYLGVDPVGIAYDAQLGSDVASKLQECAKIACEEGYPYNVSEDELKSFYDVFEKDGITYENIAFEKSYTTNGTQYTGDWTEHDADGSLIGKYTDGVFADGKGDSTAIGCLKGDEINVDIYLEGRYSIKAFKTTLYGNNWGIPDPTDPSNNISVKVFVSNDGETYTELEGVTAEAGTADGAWTSNTYTIEVENEVTAKYFRVTFCNTGFLWCDEISVYGADASNIALNKEYKISGVGVREDSYCAELTDGIAAGTLNYDKSQWFGFYNNGTNPDTNAPDKLGSATVDLEKAYEINKVRVNTVFGDVSGIASPEFIKLEISEDGINFTEVETKSFPEASTTSVEWIEFVFDEPAPARFVRLTFKIRVTFVFINEIQVLGDELTAPRYTLGDINNNSEIEKYDYILAKRAVMGTVVLDDIQHKAADVNQKDGVEKYDYILIKRHVMGTYTIED